MSAWKGFAVYLIASAVTMLLVYLFASFVHLEWLNPADWTPEQRGAWLGSGLWLGMFGPIIACGHDDGEKAHG